MKFWLTDRNDHYNAKNCLKQIPGVMIHDSIDQRKALIFGRFENVLTMKTRESLPAICPIFSNSLPCDFCPADKTITIELTVSRNIIRCYTQPV